MSADPLDDALSQIASSAPAATAANDPLDTTLAQHAAGAGAPGGSSVAGTSQEAAPPKSWEESAADWMSTAHPGFGYARHLVTGTAASAAAGVRSVYDLTQGVPLAEIDRRNREYIQKNTYNPPEGSVASSVTSAMESPNNPLNWVGRGWDAAGDAINRASDVRTWREPTIDIPASARFAGEASLAQDAKAQAPQPMPTTGTGSTWLGPVVSGAGQLATSVMPFAKGFGEGKPSWARPIEGGGELTAADIPRTATPDVLEQFKDETPAAPQAQTQQGPASQLVQQRARVLHDIGLNEARDSALHNNGPAAMSEFQTSRDPTTPLGLEARAVFDRERQALGNFSANIAQKTGGSIGTDGATLEGRGTSILKPFDDLQDWFDEQRRDLYAVADERAKGVPTDLKGFQEVLNDDSLMTNQDRVGLRSGLNAYLKKLGVVDNDGNITASAQQAETVRKYLNDEWSPQNSKLAGKLKAALDADVTEAAGSDIYQSARALVQKQKDTLENPSGLGTLLDASGPGGINRKVPLEKIPDRIMSMPQAQLEHVVTTLREMPQELQPQAQDALAELQAHYASRLTDIGGKFEGSWNHRGVNQFLDNTSGKAPLIFGEDNPLLRDMDTLRAAGNILRVDRSYPGAAIQGKILRSKLLPGAIATVGGLGGELVGSALGMPTVGSAIGSGVAGTVAKKVSEGAASKALRSRMTKLSDVVPP